MRGDASSRIADAYETRKISTAASAARVKITTV
jgi:hypothetical protein